jgi:predicted NAD/FAD-binding protein
LRFWHNHGFLGLHTQHPWRTVTNGARSYIPKITAPYRDKIQLTRRVVRVARTGNRAQLTFADGSTESADKLILACHGDQALRLLEDPTAAERRLLSPFKYQPNTATVHTDAAIMPATRRCWASWNYRIASHPDRPPQPTIHYWMNRLQGVSERQNYFVSLNADAEIDQTKVLRRIQYEHPLFNRAAVAAQRELPELNAIAASQTTFYAGAWFKYGFHEDGLTSALDCARAITREDPWL